MLSRLTTLLDSKFGLFIKLFVSSGILFFFFYTIDYNKIELIFKNINYNYLVLLFFLTIFRNYIGAVRFHYLIAIKKKIPVIQLMKQYFIASFFNNFLPTAIGGDGVRVFLISKFGVSKTDTALFIIMERLIGFYSLIIIAFLSCFFWKAPQQIKTLILVMTCGYTLMLMIIFLPKMNQLLEKFNINFFNKILNNIKLLRSNFKVIILTLLLSLFNQFISVMISYFVAEAINLEISMVVFLTLVPLVWFFTMIPISFGGVGLREISFVYLLALINISKESSIMISLGTYLTLIISGIIGMIYLLNDRVKGLNTKVNT